MRITFKIHDVPGTNRRFLLSSRNPITKKWEEEPFYRYGCFDTSIWEEVAACRTIYNLLVKERTLERRDDHFLRRALVA